MVLCKSHALFCFLSVTSEGVCKGYNLHVASVRVVQVTYTLRSVNWSSPPFNLRTAWICARSILRNITSCFRMLTDMAVRSVFASSKPKGKKRKGGGAHPKAQDLKVAKLNTTFTTITKVKFTIVSAELLLRCRDDLCSITVAVNVRFFPFL